LWEKVPSRQRGRMRGSLRGDRPLTRLAAASRRRSTLSHKGRGEVGAPVPPRPPGNETLMKQFPNATKPFWRFRANVLKRFTCTHFPNNAPKRARLGVEQGTTDV